MHSTHLRQRMERMMAYSMMVLKMLKMHVMINLSIALSLLLAADGALDLKTQNIKRTRSRRTLTTMNSAFL